MPRAIDDCQATATSDGEIFVTGFAPEDNDLDDADPEDSSSEPEDAQWCFVYRNGAWVEVADLRTAPTAQYPRVAIGSSSESLLLG